MWRAWLAGATQAGLLQATNQTLGCSVVCGKAELWLWVEAGLTMAVWIALWRWPAPEMQRTNLLEQRTQKMSWLQRRRRRDGKFDGVVNFLTVFSGVKVSNQFGGVILKRIFRCHNQFFLNYNVVKSLSHWLCLLSVGFKTGAWGLSYLTCSHCYYCLMQLLTPTLVVVQL